MSVHSRDHSLREERPLRAARFLGFLARVREARAILFLALLFVTFFALAFLIRSPYLQSIDVAITRGIQRPRTATLDTLATVFTYAGSMGTFLPFWMAACGLLLWKKRPWAAALCSAALMGHPLNWWIKSFIERPRPEAGIVEVILPAIGTSFPSGHAMSPVMFYGFLGLIAWVLIPRRKTRLALAGAATLLIFLIGASRIYVGAHWFSDVVAGWTAGLFFLLILAEAYKIVGTNELTPRA